MVSAPLPTSSDDNKERLRLWVRLLRVSRTIEAELRERMKSHFNTTLPRFDVLAALFRMPDGMMMSELSRFLLVSNGNVTGIVDRLVSDGFVARANRDGDRRASIVRLTPTGEATFRKIAAAHEAWINKFLESVSTDEARQLAMTLKSFHSKWEDEQ